MADMTTAKRLAAYRDELLAEGFHASEVAQFLESAAPSLAEDIEVQADLDDRTPLGEVRVRIVPHLNDGDLERVAERVQRTVEEAAQ